MEISGNYRRSNSLTVSYLRRELPGLGRVLLGARQSQELPLLEAVAEIAGVAIMGKERPLTLTSKNNLGSCHRTKGKACLILLESSKSSRRTIEGPQDKTSPDAAVALFLRREVFITESIKLRATAIVQRSRAQRRNIIRKSRDR